MKDPYTGKEFGIHMPGDFMPPGFGDKIIDLNALAKAGGVNDKHVLNQGPSFPIDEILLGPYSAHWVAMDTDESVIKRSQMLGLSEKIHFWHGSISEMPESWNSFFDLVINFSTLDNIGPDLHAACFQGIGRVLKTEGQFVMTYGNLHRLPERIIRSGEWIEYRFAPPEVEAALDAVGLKTIWHEYTNDRAAIVARKR